MEESLKDLPQGLLRDVLDKCGKYLYNYVHYLVLTQTHPDPQPKHTNHNNNNNNEFAKSNLCIALRMPSAHKL